jgi:hypothetical protein
VLSGEIESEEVSFDGDVFEVANFLKTGDWPNPSG